MEEGREMPVSSQRCVVRAAALQDNLLSPLALLEVGVAVGSFLPFCACCVVSALGRVEGWSSSARMVSSLDSTPAKKAPHLEDFCVVDGGDAILLRVQQKLNPGFIE